MTCSEIRQQLDAAKKIIADWEEKYSRDYERAVFALRQAMETGEKLITVKDTVIAINKMLAEIEDLKKPKNEPGK